MNTTIYIVEDNPDTYKENEHSIKDIALSNPHTVVSTKSAKELTFSEFEAELAKYQPDIIFLDYDLVWKDGQADAPNVIQAIVKYYDILNLPPIIILNTNKKEARKEVYQLLNKPPHHTISKDFILTVMSTTIQDNKEDLTEILNTCIENLKKDRAFYDFGETKLKFYKYPTNKDLSHLSLSEPKFLSEHHWLIPENRLETLPINDKNTVLFSFGTTYGIANKSKLGCIYYIKEGSTISKALFTFETTNDIDFPLFNQKEYSVFSKKSKNIIFNKAFLSGKIYSSRRLNFHERHGVLKNYYFNQMDEELKACSCNRQQHPFYKHIIIGQ